MCHRVVVDEWVWLDKPKSLTFELVLPRPRFPKEVRRIRWMAARGRVVFDVLTKLYPIQTRHFHIANNKIKRVPSIPRSLDCSESCEAILCRFPPDTIGFTVML